MDLSRIGPVMGCLSSVAFATSWILSAILFGNWKLGTDSLSSLGVCGVTSAEIVFNLGCVVTGFLVLFLGLAMAEDRNVWFRYSGIAAIVCSVACTSIGAVNEDYGDIHMLIASIYGGFAAATIALSGAGDYIEGKKHFTLLAASLLILCGISSLIHEFGTFEPIAISCILIWTFIQSLIMLVRNGKERVS